MRHTQYWYLLSRIRFVVIEAAYATIANAFNMYVYVAFILVGQRRGACIGMRSRQGAGWRRESCSAGWDVAFLG